MNGVKKIIGIAVVMAAYSVGMVAFARSTAPQAGVATLAHPANNPDRTAQQCRADPRVTGQGLLDWCLRCVSRPNQHYHPDCPQGSRCSPNNGAPQCGGGAF